MVIMVFENAKPSFGVGLAVYESYSGQYIPYKWDKTSIGITKVFFFFFETTKALLFASVCVLVGDQRLWLRFSAKRIDFPISLRGKSVLHPPIRFICGYVSRGFRRILDVFCRTSMCCIRKQILNSQGSKHYKIV